MWDIPFRPLLPRQLRRLSRPRLRRNPTIPNNLCHSISLKKFAPRSGNLTLLLGTGGVKFNLTGNLLVSGSVLFPLTNAGLRSRVTTVIGVDYAF